MFTVTSQLFCSFSVVGKGGLSIKLEVDGNFYFESPEGKVILVF